jgi:hypothetical protein
MKDMKKPKAKLKTAAHKDEKQDKALFGKMMKKEMPNMKKGCK